MAIEQLQTLRTTIKEALDGIDGLHNYKEGPDAPEKLPFTVLGNAEIDYSTDMGGGQGFNFRLFLAVLEGDAEKSFKKLNDYLASSGQRSIKAAVEAATVCNGYLVIRRVENVGRVNYRNRTFIGAEFIIHAESGGE